MVPVTVYLPSAVNDTACAGRPRTVVVRSVGLPGRRGLEEAVRRQPDLQQADVGARVAQRGLRLRAERNRPNPSLLRRRTYPPAPPPRGGFSSSIRTISSRMAGAS